MTELGAKQREEMRNVLGHGRLAVFHPASDQVVVIKDDSSGRSTPPMMFRSSLWNHASQTFYTVFTKKPADYLNLRDPVRRNLFVQFYEEKFPEEWLNEKLRQVELQEEKGDQAKDFSEARSFGRR